MNAKASKKTQPRWLTYGEALELAHKGNDVELVYPPGEGIPCRLAGTNLERFIAVGEDQGWIPAPEHGVFREKA